MFSLRLATLADVDAVTSVLEKAYGQLLAADYPPDELAAALPLITRAQPDLLASGTYYVAVADGIIGCGGWTRERPDTRQIEPGVVHLRHFATDPAHTQRGVGRAIVERCIEDAARGGAEHLACFATLSAERFYHALGFVSERPMTLDVGGMKFDAVLMGRAC